jgi:hypothetical protein
LLWHNHHHLVLCVVSLLRCASHSLPGLSGWYAANVSAQHWLLAGVLTETTAELAAALTLAAARRVPEADVFMRAGHYKGWLPTLFIGNLLQVMQAD